MKKKKEWGKNKEIKKQYKITKDIWKDEEERKDYLQQELEEEVNKDNKNDIEKARVKLFMVELAM